MAIDIYQPRRMAAALKEMKPPRQFLKNLFFARSETFDTEHVDVDQMTKVRRLAPFVNAEGPGKVIDRDGFTTDSVTPPMIAPKRPITVRDLQQRTMGEVLYSGRSPDSRAAELLGADLAELDEMIARRIEWMCAQVLFTSQVRALGEDVNKLFTFTRHADCTKGLLVAASRWDAATADIPKLIRDWRRTIVQLTGTSPNVLLCSPEAIDAMLKSSDLATRLHTQRMDLGLIAPELRESGATYIGSFAGTGIDIWTYDEWYVDPADGVEKPMVPAKTVLLGSTNAYTSMRYGAVGIASGSENNAQLGLVAAERVPDSWTTKEPPVRWLKISSRPLPVPIQNNAFLTAQVVA